MKEVSNMARIKKIFAYVITMATMVTGTIGSASNVAIFAEENDSLGEYYSPMDDSISSAEYNDFVVSWNQSGNRVNIELANISNITALENWSLVYSCDEAIVSAENAEIVSADEVHYLTHCEENNIIAPNSATEIILTFDTYDIVDKPDDFMVYFQYDTNEYAYVECTDSITYECTSDELSLNEVDECELTETVSTLSSADDDLAAIEAVAPGVSTRKVNYVDNRELVSDPTVYPYSCIAALTVTWPDGSTSRATGFMISNHYLATSAHVVYNADKGGGASKVTAYFGRNGATSSYVYTASSYTYCVNYPTTPTCGNDWAVCYFSSSVGNNVGWFSIGYTTDDALSSYAISVTGYPGDKKVANSNAPDGYNRYMYTASSRISSVYDYSFRYSADTREGESGAPVYRGTEGTVYGIHHGGVTGEYLNQAKRITQAIFNTWMNNGWIS